MRKIILILSVLFSVTASAQNPDFPSNLGTTKTGVKANGAVVVDSLFGVPNRDTSDWQYWDGITGRKITYFGGVFYGHTGTKWERFAMGQGGGIQWADTARNRYIATYTYVDSIARGLVEDDIIDGVTDKAPSENVVYDVLLAKAPLASPALTGNPTAPTQSPNNNSTRIATTAYADAKVADAITNGVTTIAPSQNIVFDSLAAHTIRINNAGGGGGSNWTVNGDDIYPTGFKNIGLVAETAAEAPIHYSGSAGMYGIMEPSNFGTAYGGALGTANRFVFDGWAIFPGVNPDPRPNVVATYFGYNTAIGGGRIDTTDAGFGFRTETFYFADGAYRHEYHLPEFYAKNGGSYRLLSFHPSVEDGQCYVQSTTDSWSWVVRDVPGPMYWAGLSPGSFYLDNYGTPEGLEPPQGGYYMEFSLGGINLTNDGYGGSIFLMRNTYVDGSMIMQYAQPAGKSFGLSAQTINLNSAGVANSMVNLYGNVSIPTVGKGLVVGGGNAATSGAALRKVDIYGDGNTNATAALVTNNTSGDLTFVVFDNGDVVASDIYGSASIPAANLTLNSTLNATKGKIVFGSLSAYDEVNDRIGVGTLSPPSQLSAVCNQGLGGSSTHGLTIENINSAGFAYGVLINDQDEYLQFLNMGSAFAYGPLEAYEVSQGVVVSSGANGLNLAANAATGFIKFVVGGTLNTNEAMRIKSNRIINLSNVPEYASEADAISAGLVAGDLYQTGNQINIVD